MRDLSAVRSFRDKHMQVLSQGSKTAWSTQGAHIYIRRPLGWNLSPMGILGTRAAVTPTQHRRLIVSRLSTGEVRKQRNEIQRQSEGARPKGKVSKDPLKNSGTRNSPRHVWLCVGAERSLRKTDPASGSRRLEGPKRGARR